MLQDALCFPAIPAEDLSRARSFYAEKLGLTPAREDVGGLIFETGKGTGFLLYQSQFAGTNQATAMGFQVSDFDAVTTELRRRGISFEEYDLPDVKTDEGIMTMPDGTRGCWFKDSEGNIIALDDRA